MSYETISACLELFIAVLGHVWIRHEQSGKLQDRVGSVPNTRGERCVK